MSQKWSKDSWARSRGQASSWNKGRSSQGGWGKGNFTWKRTSEPWPKPTPRQVPRPAPRQYTQQVPQPTPRQVPQQYTPQVDDLIDFSLPDTTPTIQERDPTMYFTPNKPDSEFPRNEELYHCIDPFFNLVHYFPTEELEGMTANPEENIEGMKSDFKYNCVVITSFVHTMSLNKITSAEMYQMIQPYVIENIRLYQAICWLTNALYKFPKPDEAFCGMVKWEPKQKLESYEAYFLCSFDNAFRVANSAQNEFDFDSAEEFVKNWQVLFRIDYTYLPGGIQELKDRQALWRPKLIPQTLEKKDISVSTDPITFPESDDIDDESRFLL